MIYWNTMMVAAGGLLLFLVYKECTRKNKVRLAARLTASVLAVTSLLFMAYPYAGRPVATANKIVLLTDGFVQDSLDQFLHQSSTIVPVFADESMLSPVAAGIQRVTNWKAFVRNHTADTIHIFGNGLSKKTLAEFDLHPFVFHASPARPAISRVWWKQHLLPGESLMVQGHYENTAAQKIKLVLQAFGTDRDSAWVDALSSHDFVLRTVPVHAGQAVYSLITTTGRDTLAQEPIPVSVETARPLQLLIIDASPNFENTFLKNHLSRQGYQVSAITTISSHKTDKQFLNSTLQPAATLTRSYLRKFDILLTDEESLQNITPVEQAALRAAISEEGTGLLITLDAQKKDSRFYTPFFPVKELQPNARAAVLLHEAGTDSNRYTIKLTDSISIEQVPGTHTLLQDAASNVYAAETIYGNGKIVVTTLSNTYSMALAGNTNAYQQLWRLLLNKAAKQIPLQQRWQTEPFIPFANSQALLQVDATDTTSSKAVIDQTSIYLKQDVLLPFQWQGKYWPHKAGWQPLPQINVETGNWYVYQPGNWKQLIDYNNLTETKKFADLHTISLVQQATGPASSFLNWPLLMLLLFLSGCSFLWVEQKMV